MSRSLFLNIPVGDLARSMDFFKKLGFSFNAQFTDDTAACLVVSDDAFVMLLTRKRFADFARRPIADAGQQTGAIYAFSAGSRAEVDRIASVALESGGARAGETMDHGFMYLRSFYDPDGHHWEVLWMDPAALVQPPKAG
jgi:predicted lactoylglutathione lyase